MGVQGAFRGPGGGYRLVDRLEAINVSDIIEAVGEGVDATRCHGAADCQDGSKCLTHDLWAELSAEINDFLHSVTLESLVRRADRTSGAAPLADQLIAARHL